ncbi:MAG: DUF1330 domain-containing protein [Kiloniellaceae bacterium]
MAAYWIARVNVTDEAAYAEYSKRAGPIFDRHGGRLLARGDSFVTLEGREFARNVITEFPTLEQALACYRSPEYREALALAEGAVERDICIVEGM